MVNLHAGIFVIVRSGIDITQNGRNTSTKRVIQEHLADSGIEQRIGGVCFDSNGHLVDHGSSTGKFRCDETRCGDNFCDFGYLIHMIGTTVDRSDGDFLTGFQSNGTNGSKRGRSLGVTILFTVNKITDRASFKTARTGHASGFSKHFVLVIDDRQQSGLFVGCFDKRKAVVTLFFNGHLGRITGLGRHFVKRHGQSIVGVVHTKPTLEGTSHALEHAIEFSTTGFHFGQTIQNLQLEVKGSGVGKTGTTNQGGEVLFGKNVVFDTGGEPVQTIDFLDFDLVRADVQDTLWLVGIVLGIVEVTRS
mmetsp:Transcript_43/g.78  ORF Transcript_43/g.78 Transcript_43/m.78 type:complete len:305 (-) Transcript_43:820-1734(-)